MNGKTLKTETFVAKADAGAEWRIAVNAAKGKDFATKQAATFARNHCLKHGMRGDVTITSEADGRAFKMHDFVCPVDPESAKAWLAARNA